MEEKAPGLLLQAIPYLGQKKILKVLTPNLGVISLIAKKNHDNSLTTPFCLAEWVYRKGRNDLYLLLDGALFHPLFDLRLDYKFLCSAGAIAKDLLRLQMPGEPCPELFTLSSSIFQKMASFEEPEMLVALFRMKWLQQEGLLMLQPICTACGAKSRFLQEGESRCKEHATRAISVFTDEEWAHFEDLSHGRTFSYLKSLQPVFSLYPKIFSLFEERFKQ